jgi:hypothetical protein
MVKKILIKQKIDVEDLHVPINKTHQFKTLLIIKKTPPPPILTTKQSP